MSPLAAVHVEPQPQKLLLLYSPLKPSAGAAIPAIPSFTAVAAMSSKLRRHAEAWSTAVADVRALSHCQVRATLLWHHLLYYSSIAPFPPSFDPNRVPAELTRATPTVSRHTDEVPYLSPSPSEHRCVAPPMANHML
jgi:hypothetical protein